MKKKELIPVGIKYYKANLHCHTTLSDGALTPEQVKKAYKERGYQIIAFTDHRKYMHHTELDDETFLTIAGMETDVTEPDEAGTGFSRLKSLHINWYDLNPWEHQVEKAALSNMEYRYYDREYIGDYVENMRRLGFLPCYNHAYWSLHDCRDYIPLQGLWAMEIYNHGSEQFGLYGFTPQAYDEMLRSGHRIFCVAADDNHNNESFDDSLCDSFGGYVMIGARSFTYAGVMDALQKGEYYSVVSQEGDAHGPEIYEMTLVDNRLFVRCSPVHKIYLHNSGRSSRKAAARPGGTITEASFLLEGGEGYIRLDIRDSHGRRACSNGYFLDDILAED